MRFTAGDHNMIFVNEKEQDKEPQIQVGLMTRKPAHDCQPDRL
jgi:hypothetical protein